MSVIMELPSIKLGTRYQAVIVRFTALCQGGPWFEYLSDDYRCDWFSLGFLHAHTLQYSKYCFGTGHHIFLTHFYKLTAQYCYAELGEQSVERLGNGLETQGMVVWFPPFARHLSLLQTGPPSLIFIRHWGLFPQGKVACTWSWPFISVWWQC